jgi:DNA polymerase III subunit epsilon
MNRIVYFDFETTGPDPYIDRVVEFSFHSDAGTWTERVNPGVPIPVDATEVHGISDADVADKPRFDSFADQIQHLVDGAVLCGYSSRRFDVVVLHQELKRAGCAGLPTNKINQIIVQEIDLLEIWKRCEERTLVTAAKRFGGIDLENAHSADADTAALAATLDGMCAAFGLDRDNIDQLMQLSVPEDSVDRDGKFVKREDGEVIYNFGKVKGTPVRQDLGFLDWMLRQSFITPETKAIAEILRQRALRKVSPAGIEDIPVGAFDK